MKKYIFLGIAFTILSSCNGPKKKSDEISVKVSKGEDCSISVSGVEFTKSINAAKSLVSLNDDQLKLQSGAESDNFNDPDGQLSSNSAPVLLSKLDNTKPFTFTAKINPLLKDTYDAGALYIYLNPEWWFKFAFELDEHGKSRVVTVRTNATSDDNNHDLVEADELYFKISSDTKTIGFYYSTDNDHWQLVRLFKNDYPSESWIGLSTQSPTGEGTSATFKDISLTPNPISDFRRGE